MHHTALMLNSQTYYVHVYSVSELRLKLIQGDGFGLLIKYSCSCCSTHSVQLLYRIIMLLLCYCLSECIKLMSARQKNVHVHMPVTNKSFVYMWYICIIYTHCSYSLHCQQYACIYKYVHVCTYMYIHCIYMHIVGNAN